jgi:NDP-sugar pyrophosphorylase family protein
MPVDLSILFGRLIEQRRLFAEITDKRFVDIGTPDRYHDFQRQLGREGHRQGAPL